VNIEVDDISEGGKGMTGCEIYIPVGTSGR